MHAELWQLGLVALSGIGAGFINAMAGGGSLLTLPALMLTGLPADVANGSNRLSVLTQAVTGTLAYRRAGKLPTQAIPQTLLPTIAGSLVGALAASYTPTVYLKPILLCTLAAMAVLMTLMPKFVKTSGDNTPKTLRERPWGSVGLFFSGVYAGYVQAGVGFVLLAILEGLLHFDLVRANALKLIASIVFGLVSLVVFVSRGQVAWLPATVLAVTSAAGSVLGVRFALRINPRNLRWVIVSAVIVVCIAALLKD